LIKSIVTIIYGYDWKTYYPIYTLER